MKNRNVLSAMLVAGFVVSPTRAEDSLSDHLGFFANAKEVFQPLLADPREIQLALRLTAPVSQRSLGDISVGEYFGLYRWALPWTDSYIQWSIAGGFFARFDLVAPEKDLQVIDFIASMPIDMRVGKWTMRLFPHHLSSHLGDDYVKRTGAVPEKYSFDSFKWLTGYEPWNFLRLYSGFHYIIRNHYVNRGRFVVQGGAEWRSGWWGGRHAQTYFGGDIQAWERVGWTPDLNTQLGIRFARHPEDKQTIAIFTEYGNGHIAYGQFFEQKETHWVLGLRFDIS